MGVPAELRRQVIDRAAGRCEYCRLSQKNQEATFHVDHVVPVSVHGPTDMGNLALACVSCSLSKGARQHVIDRESGEEVRLFNPRVDRWSDHFEWNGVSIKGRTIVGRATVHALQLNRGLALAIRNEEKLAGRHPLN
jgi:hypothetical protein